MGSNEFFCWIFTVLFCAQTWLGKLAAIEYVGQNRNFCGTVNVLQNAISFFLKEVQILIHECKEILERIAFYLLNRYGTVCTEGLCLTQDCGELFKTEFF